MKKHLSSTSTSTLGQKTSHLINKTKLILGLATVLAFSACEKQGVEPTNPDTTQNSNNGNTNTVTETTDHAARVEKYKAEFETNRVPYNDRYKAFPFNHWDSYFEKGIIGVAQYRKIVSSSLDKIDGSKKITLHILDSGHPEIDRLLSDYPQLIKGNVIMLKRLNIYYKIIENSVISGNTQVFTSQGLDNYNNHGAQIISSLFMQNGGLGNLQDFDYLFKKFGANSPLKLDFDGITHIEGVLDSEENILSKYKNLGTKENEIAIVSFSNGVPTNNGQAIENFERWNQKNCLWMYTQPNSSLSALEQNGDPSFQIPSLKATQIYNKLDRVIINSGVDQKTGILEPKKAFDYGSYSNGTTNLAPMWSTYSQFSTTNAWGNSIATPMEAYKAGIEILLSPKLNQKNYKKFLYEKDRKTGPQDGPVDRTNAGRDIFLAMGILPISTTAGIDNNYEIPVDFDVFDPTGKVETYLKNNKVYLRKKDGDANLGKTLELVARIPYQGSVYFAKIIVDVASGTSSVYQSKAMLIN